jgi:hypothetical protein
VAPANVPQKASQLSVLAEDLDALEKAVGRLEEVLAPYRNQDPKTGPPQGGADHPSATALQVVGMRIRRVDRRLSELLDEVDL